MLSGEPVLQLVNSVLICPGKPSCASSLAPSRLPPDSSYSPSSPRGTCIQPVLPLKVQLLVPRSGCSLKEICVVFSSGDLAYTVKVPFRPSPSYPILSPLRI